MTSCSMGGATWPLAAGGGGRRGARSSVHGRDLGSREQMWALGSLLLSFQLAAWSLSADTVSLSSPLPPSDPRCKRRS